MDYKQFDSETKNSIQDLSETARLNHGQDKVTDAVDEGSNEGDLNILCVQNLSDTIQGEIQGGRYSVVYTNESFDEDASGDGGRDGGDWIINHNQTLVALKE